MSYNETELIVFQYDSRLPKFANTSLYCARFIDFDFEVKAFSKYTSREFYKQDSPVPIVNTYKTPIIEGKIFTSYKDEGPWDLEINKDTFRVQICYHNIDHERRIHFLGIKPITQTIYYDNGIFVSEIGFVAGCHVSNTNDI